MPEFPPKPGIASPEARYASLEARYRFPHDPVVRVLSYRAWGEARRRDRTFPQSPVSSKWQRTI